MSARRSSARGIDDPDVLVVGGGPAGLAAATEASRAGASALLVERDDRLGGILNQCVHDGFGLELFKESLTGPEYAARLVAEADAAGVAVALGTSVLQVADGPTLRVLGPGGYRSLSPCAVVLAMGCRERSFGSLMVAGPRPAGIYSAGAAQRMVNVDGLMVGRRAVVLGSGDVGLIMARRMVLEGAEVECVVERLPFPGGLARNISQCLNDFGIPLLLEHTVVGVFGQGRLEAVAIAQVDSAGRLMPGTRRRVECDTLLVSVGLIPENELTREAGATVDPASGGACVDQRLMTDMPGVFACGNVLHVHDLADWASLEARGAGVWAARWAARPWPAGEHVHVAVGSGLRYVVPQHLKPDEDASLSFRVEEPLARARVTISREGVDLASRRFPYLAPSELATIDLPAPGPGPGLEVRVEAG